MNGGIPFSTDALEPRRKAKGVKMDSGFRRNDGEHSRLGGNNLLEGLLHHPRGCAILKFLQNDDAALIRPAACEAGTLLNPCEGLQPVEAKVGEVAPVVPVFGE